MFPFYDCAVEAHKRDMERRMFREVTALRKELAEVKEELKKLKDRTTIRRYEYAPYGGGSQRYDLAMDKVVSHILDYLKITPELVSGRKSCIILNNPRTRFQKLCQFIWRDGKYE